MTETAHLIVGAAIASRFPNPVLASSLAILSHAVLDMVPHWDTGTNWRKRPIKKTVLYTAADIAIGTILSIFFFGSKVPINYMFFIMFMSTLPDWLEAPYLFLGIKTPLFAIIYKTQHLLHRKQELPWGIISQVAFLAVLLFILFLAPSLTALAK